MNDDQYNYEENFFPTNYYYPQYYYPMQQSQDQFQQSFQNYNQPLFFEIPDENSNVQQGFPQNIPPFIQYFQDDDGEVDIDKVISTANQFMKTASQIAPMVKSLNDFVKGLKL